MTGRGRVSFAVLGLVVLGVAVLGGCTTGQAEQPDGRLTGTPSGPPPSTAASGPLTVHEREVSVRFETADETPRGSTGWDNLVGRSYLVVPDPDRGGVRDSNKVFIDSVPDRRRVAIYVTSRPDRTFYRAFFWQGGAVISEHTAGSGPDGERIHLFRLDLPGGKPRALAARDGRRLGFLDAADLSGDVLGVPIAKDGQDDRCLHAFNLSQNTEADLYCVPAGHRIFTARAAAGGFTIVETAGADLTGCRSAYWIPAGAPTKDAARVGPRTCDVLDHARLGDWTLWSQNEDLRPDTVLQGRSGSRTVTLGPIRINSLVACGTHAYWLRASDAGDEIVRWAAGSDTVEIVYQAKTIGAAGDGTLRSPHCNQDVIATGYDRTDPVRRRIVYLPAA